jgi:plastocyanin
MNRKNQMLRKRLRLGALLPLVAALGCDSARLSPPVAEPSSPAAATALVHVEAGQPFAPACLIVASGATVEWRNLSPAESAVVLSLRAPYELTSPSMTAPYNLVPAAASDECGQRVNGSCVDPEAYSFWRHTFSSPGLFDYQNSGGGGVTTSAGDGDEVITAPPSTSSAPSAGTVCVTGPGSECQQVCCTGTVAGECAAGVQCLSGRCGGVK